MDAQGDFFRSAVASVDKEIKQANLSADLRCSIIHDAANGGDLTIYVRGEPLAELNFTAQPFIHLGTAADPLEIRSAGAAVRLSDHHGRELSPDELAREIVGFLRSKMNNERKQ
jgi:hypothetical protein